MREGHFGMGQELWLGRMLTKVYLMIAGTESSQTLLLAFGGDDPNYLFFSFQKLHKAS